MSRITKILLVLISVLFFFSKNSFSANTLVPNQFLGDTQTLVSPNERFELGFFSPGTSKNKYLGIWYKNIAPKTVVWVANRNIPVTNSSGVLKIDDNGVLVINQGETVVWSCDRPKRGSTVVDKPMAMLLDSGNFVLTKEGASNQESYEWQSFDHFTDTLLPGMKLGWDLDAGFNNSLVSWKSDEDPSPGAYSFVVEPYGSPEMYMLHEQSPIFRTGIWNGIRFSGVPEMKSHQDGFTFDFVFNGNQKYYSYTINASMISRSLVDKSGIYNRLVWLEERGWISYWKSPKDDCDRYKGCGPYGICNANNLLLCSCLKGFEPSNEVEWASRDWSSGCARKTTYVCGKDDGFLPLKRMKLPDGSHAYYNVSMNLKDCREMCEKNCSCTAYARPDIRDGLSGCIFWIGDLVDLRQFVTGGQDLYVRMAASELGSNHKKVVIIISATVVAVILVLGLSVCFVSKRKEKRIQQSSAEESVSRVKSQEVPLYHMFRTSARESFEDHQSDEPELPLIDFEFIVAITNNFSNVNKLGEGGFGVVYEGILADGQHVAVKRLSKTSLQGVHEFKNEVVLIAKLQHRNLVRLLGCCIKGEEKILIYEYMPNKSLDTFLFDKRKSSILDWEKRFNIIVGIARGLLYLHQDSRFRIVHRDLKASNILLDDEMSPKISDFGMARIFGGNQSEANTTRVVGTYGYMAPEYAMDGLFSVKSDVFSYGVLMLEILSGRRNRGFYSPSNELNLLGHAWALWEEGKSIELIDETLRNTASTYEVMKCLRIALLCVQEHAEERPTIASVFLMLNNETATQANPNKPGISLGRTPPGQTSSSNDYESGSVNNMTITKLAAR
ncbi:hypothetical protein ACHQM5_003839 [Ranunculus cassubicifolius]